MSEEANQIIPRFKSNQGLSNQDLSVIFQVSIKTAKDWAKGLQVDPKAEAVAIALNTMIERWKKEKGAWNDVDYQHLMKNAENLQKENEVLKETIRQLEDAETLKSKPGGFSIEQIKLNDSEEALQNAVLIANKPDENKYFDDNYDFRLSVEYEVI